MNFAIVEYGTGNVANVKNAFEKLDIDIAITKNNAAIRNADAVVLPGVGAFSPAMKRLAGRTEFLKQLIEDGKPFLGICLGMQLLFERSEESVGTKGLWLVKGSVKKFRVDLPIPQIGWNIVQPIDSPLFDGIKAFQAYFVHSYYCIPKERSYVSATSNYGVKFCSAIWKNNLFATQFHPEKSGEKGLCLLKNFIREVKK